MAAFWAYGLGATVVGWFIAPLIAFLLPKFIALFGFDASKKLKHLKIDILQLLEDTLPEVDEARIVERGKTSSELSRLHELAAMLRHAQEDAEDILHDHKAIELYRSRWLERLCTISTCVACFTWICVWIALIVRGGSAWLLQWFMGPGLLNEDQGASRPGLPANEDQGASRPVVPVNEDPAASRPVVSSNEDQGASRQGARILRSVSAWLLQWFMGPGLLNEDQGASRPGVPANEDQGASRPVVPANEDQGASHEGAPANEDQGESSQGVPANADQEASRPAVPANEDEGVSIQGACILRRRLLFKVPMQVATVIQATNKVCVACVRSKSTPLLPVTTNDATLLDRDQGAAHEGVLANAYQGAAHEGVLANAYQGAAHEGVLANADQEPSRDGVLTNADQGASRQGVLESRDQGASHEVFLANGDQGASHEGVLANEDQGSSHQGVPANEDQGASREGVPANEDQGPSHEGVPANVSATAPSSSSFDVFKNRCRSTIDRVLSAYNEACSQRDLCYKGAGITSKLGMLDCVITAISKQNLKKRIDEVESTVNDVKKSAALIIGKSTLDVSSEKNSTPDVSLKKKSTPDVSDKNSTQPDIVKEKRSEIRTASNHEVFGLVKFRDSIMEKLRMTPQSSSTSPCYSAIGIYGVSGSGKTTFARYIRDHIKEECKDENLFHTIMCIHVSNTFNVKEIFQNMLKDITNDHNTNVSDPVKLEKKLEKSLKDKRFFLILDDFWVEDKNNKDLKKLISVLKVGLKGSKILVTAQTKAAAGALSSGKADKMPVLHEDQCLSILMHYALGDTSVVDRDHFTRVGRDIVKKLGRSPIAAAIVAVRLGENLDTDDWENIAQLDMLSDTRAALWWSYKKFSPDIRRCFEYLNIFPKGIALKKDDIVCLWTAQGFVKTNKGNEYMEAVAEAYIQELVSFSFLRHEKNKWGGDFYRIHDMLHDLVDNITQKDYFRIESARGERGEEKMEPVVPRDVRHLFFQNYDAELINKEIPGLDNLRTLIIYDVEEDAIVEEKVIESICKLLPKLRVLAVAFKGEIYKHKKFSFPESIRLLKRLHYLAFRTCRFSEVILPSAFTELWHIQMLYFGGAKIHNIGRLTLLQEIANFTVRDEAGYELHQLGGLDKLRGRLEIFGLENVKNQDEAVKANLFVKKRLRMLILLWSRDEVGQAEHVLESLCPPVKLQELIIQGYKGSAYPGWMEDREKGGPKDLDRLWLWSFGQQGPPPQFVVAFPRLRVLVLWYCSWDALPDNMKDLASLEKLTIFECPNIKSLPTLPLSVLSINIDHCNDEFMKSCQVPGEENYEKVKHIRLKLFKPPILSRHQSALRFQAED